MKKILIVVLSIFIFTNLSFAQTKAKTGTKKKAAKKTSSTVKKTKTKTKAKTKKRTKTKTRAKSKTKARKKAKAVKKPNQTIVKIKKDIKSLNSSLNKLNTKLEEIKAGYKDNQESLGQLNSALGELNIKLEGIASQYIQLIQEIDKLYLADKDIRRIVIEQNVARPESARVGSLEKEMGLVRSELSQIREDVSLLNVKEPVKKRENEKSKHSWLPIASIGLSIIALLVAL